MARIVLDKSALIAATPGKLCEFNTGNEYVLGPTFRYEVATDPCRNPETVGKKILQLRGYWLADLNELVYWELKEGCSAKDGDVFQNNDDLFARRILDVGEGGVGEYENGWANLARIRLDPADRDTHKKISAMGKRAFFQYLDNCHDVAAIAKEAQETYAEAARERGLHVSDDFKPAPDWLCYGLALVTRFGLAYKFWRFGDATTGPKKPANFGLDLMYVATMAIADGLLSADDSMLDFAWACWPEKRPCLYGYDMRSGDISVFSPRWA